MKHLKARDTDVSCDAMMLIFPSNQVGSCAALVLELFTLTLAGRIQYCSPESFWVNLKSSSSLRRLPSERVVLPLPESEVTFRSRDGHVIRLDLASNESDVILSNSTFVSVVHLMCVCVLARKR